LKKVLILASGFPPQGGGGVTRVHSFVKYLPRFGWQPTILTLKEGYAYAHALDSSLLKEYDPGVRIYRTNSMEPALFFGKDIKNQLTGLGDNRTSSRNMIKKIAEGLYDLLLIPDERILWLPMALHKGVKIISRNEIDIIFSTSPPHSVGVTGHFLHKLTGIPHIWDVRDDWVGNRYFEPRFWHRKKIEAFLEYKVVANCRNVILVTQASQTFMTKKYPVAENRFHLITNGFDPEDFQSFKNDQSQKREKCRLVYSGSLTKRRNIIPFFRALSDSNFHNSLKEKLEIVFVGSVHQNNLDAANEFGLQGIVEFVGHVTHRESIQFLQSSDACLLISTSEEGSRTVIPSKVYEYIAAQKYILAIADPESAVAKLIGKEDIGMVVSPDNISSIKNAIINILELCRKDKIRPDSYQELQNRFNRIHLTQELAEVFNQSILPSS
jgi:glycosyltransferase involved in cell wall biosynthesis